MMGDVLAGLGPVVLVMAIAVSLAGLQDLLSRRISNLFPALIVLLFVAANFVAGWRVDVWQNLASFALIFVIGSWLFQRGVLGGGDVKLWAAVALWFDLSQLSVLVISISLAGGVLAIVSIVRRLLRRRKPGLKGKTAPSLKDARSVPYGVAIALGTIVTVATAGTGLRPEPSASYQHLNSSLMNTIAAPK